MDANFINQSLDSTELCDVSTLEILLRNADIGNLYNLKTQITLPLEGATFVPNSFEYAYPSGAAYQPINGMPDSLGATQRGISFQFNDFSKFNNYLSQYGIKGFNPTNPNDSNQIKIRFKYTSDCSFRSGSLVYFNFDGYNACGAPGNNEIGESAPLFLKGASLDSLKEFSVSSSSSNVFVAGGESIIEIQFKNKNTTPSGPRDVISIKLPAGVSYKPHTSTAILPASWIIGEPAVRKVGNIQILTWAQPQGLLVNEDAALQFIVRTDDSLSCSGSKDISLATYYVKDIICKSGGLCRTEIITTSGNKEQFFSIPLSRKPISLLSNLFIDNNKMYVPQNDTAIILATGAQIYEWYDLDSNKLIHNDSLLRFSLKRDSAHLMVTSGIKPSCVDSALVTLYWLFDTIAPTITVRDTSIACHDTFPLIRPTVTDDKTFNIKVSYRDSLVNNPCGDVLYRIWTAIDSVGNTTRATQRITKVDNIAPVFTTVPANKTIQYFETLPNDNPSATDACTAANVVLIKIDTIVAGKDTTFIKNWEATDACGNKSTATQTVIKRYPSVINRRDTIMVGDSITFCLSSLGLPGTINKVESCSTGNSGNASYTLDGSNCLKIKGLQKGYDSTCYTICTSLDTCITVKVTTLIRYPNTKDTVKTNVQVGDRDTICFNTGKLIGTTFTLTNICEDTVTTATFEVYNQTCIIVKGNREGEKKGCFVLCDTTGKCDTMIITVNVLPSVFERKDTIFVGDSVVYCVKDLTILKGNINSIVNECSSSSGKATSYNVDFKNCIVVKGIKSGIDTTCLKVCTDSNQCFKITLITTVFNKTDTLEFMRHDSIYVGDSVCFSMGNGILKGNIINVQNNCSTTSNRAAKYSFEPSNCLSIKGIKTGIDTACLVVCTDSNICIKIRAVTTVLNKNNNNNSNIDTIRLVYEVGDIDTVCLPNSITKGMGISIKELCPNTENKTVSYTIYKDTCLIITARTKGSVIKCLSICDTTNTCDTVILDITVLASDSVKSPIANFDTARTLINQKVVISPLLNDSIYGTLDTVRVMTIPFNGTAVANKDSLGRWTIAYTPEKGFCNTEEEDEFVYEICNTHGCDTALIYVRVLCEKLKIYNAFSPNGDNKNDVFYIDGLSNFPNTHVKVYNRWGNLVFEDKDYKNDWKGVWNGMKLPDGTYFYHIDLENGESYTGFLQIHH